MYETGSDRIEKIFGRGANPNAPADCWIYDYTDGKLTEVESPVAEGLSRYVQEFSYGNTIAAGYRECTYTNILGGTYTYRITSIGDLHSIQVPQDAPNTVTFVRDAAHNLLSVTNPLGDTRSFTYGDAGEPLTGTAHPDPNTPQIVTFTWEQPDPNLPYFRRLTKVEDPLGHWVEYGYDPNYPLTAIATVTEMAADPNDPNDPNGVAVTRIAYYDDPNQPHSYGQVESITDANGVKTQMAYSTDNAFLSSLAHGSPGSQFCVNWRYKYDNLGRQTASECNADRSDGGGSVTYDPHDNNTRSASCVTSWPQSPRSAPSRLTSSTVPWPTFNELKGSFGTSQAEYDARGNLLSLSNYISNTADNNGWGISNTREIVTTYDRLSRPLSQSVTTDEADWDDAPSFTHTNEYGYHLNASKRIGVHDDWLGRFTISEFDVLGRVCQVDTSSGSAYYTYDSAGQLTLVEYSRGTTIYARTQRWYDDAGRLTAIEHQKGPSPFVTMERLEYTWNLDNTVAQRDEWEYDDQGALISTATVLFRYDNRRRLIAESRAEGVTTVFHYKYDYDDLGNRLTKVDDLNDWLTTYDYDVNYAAPNELEYWTQDNRLLSYTLEDVSDPNDPVLLRTVRYTYYDDGNVSNISVRDGDTPRVKDLAFFYARNKSPWIAVWGEWGVDGNGVYDPNDPNDAYAMTDACEMRLTGPARNFIRKFDANDPDHAIDSGQLWTDEFCDFEPLPLDPNNPGYPGYECEVKRYYPGGFAQHDVDDDTVWSFHGDLIGSTTLMLSDAGGDTTPFTYTAFGEVVAMPDPNGLSDPNDPNSTYNPTTRYQYAGAFGYESGMFVLHGTDPSLPPITITHVGHRLYDPGVGRFYQQDPIGIAGGLNVYLYCGGNPVTGVDPLGLQLARITGEDLIFEIENNGYPVQIQYNGVWYDIRGSHRQRSGDMTFYGKGRTSYFSISPTTNYWFGAPHNGNFWGIRCLGPAGKPGPKPPVPPVTPPPGGPPPTGGGGLSAVACACVLLLSAADRLRRQPPRRDKR